MLAAVNGEPAAGVKVAVTVVRPFGHFGGTRHLVRAMPFRTGTFSTARVRFFRVKVKVTVPVTLVLEKSTR